MKNHYLRASTVEQNKLPSIQKYVFKEKCIIMIIHFCVFFR